MSTRACYIFKDDLGSHTVYKHGDGDPSWAWRYYADTIASGLAWELPRFEADEFAAAFIARNKVGAGSVRLVERWNYIADIRYLYKLSMSKGNVLILKVESVSAPMRGPVKPSRWKRTTVFRGPLHRLIFAKGDCVKAANAKSSGLRIACINEILTNGGSL